MLLNKFFIYEKHKQTRYRKKTAEALEAEKNKGSNVIYRLNSVFPFDLVINLKGLLSMFEIN